MLDLAVAACGIAVILLVWMSVLRTTLIPRRFSSRMARWTARICATAGLRLARVLPARPREWLKDLCVPVSLFAMAAGWLIGLAVGFLMVMLALDEARLSATFPFVEIEMSGAVVAMAVVAGASAAIVAAAFAAHLVRFMEAYGRREGMITRSAVQLQRVTDADMLVATYLSAGSRDSLDTYFARWAGWLADIQNSHVSYPGLVYHPSTGTMSWQKAAMIVMDVAAVVEAVAPSWAPVHTKALLDVGSDCLQCLAQRVGIVLPFMTVSLHGREEREFVDTVQLAGDAGLPIERDVDKAWTAFQRIRVRYAPYAVQIGSKLLSP